MLGNHVMESTIHYVHMLLIHECLFIRSKILSTVPNIEPNIPKMTKLQFLIKIHLGHGSCLTAKSNNAGVMSDKVDIQIAPDNEMKRSKSGTSKAVPSLKKNLILVPIHLRFARFFLRC